MTASFRANGERAESCWMSAKIGKRESRLFELIFNELFMTGECNVAYSRKHFFHKHVLRRWCVLDIFRTFLFFVANQASATGVCFQIRDSRHLHSLLRLVSVHFTRHTEREAFGEVQ